jgi:hypothetical protein
MRKIFLAFALFATFAARAQDANKNAIAAVISDSIRTNGLNKITASTLNYVLFRILNGLIDSTQALNAINGQKGLTNGIPQLSAGTVPLSQLPATVDTVLISGDTLKFSIHGQFYGLLLPSATSDSTDTLSLSARINQKLNIADTSNMLSAYLRYGLGMKYSDTAFMLSTYLRAALGVKYSDTAAMLAPYLRVANFTKAGIGLGSVVNFLQMINYGNVPGALGGPLASLPSANSAPVGTLYIAPDSGRMLVDTGVAFVSAGWKVISGGGSGSSQNLAQVLATGRTVGPDSLIVSAGTYLHIKGGPLKTDTQYIGPVAFSSLSIDTIVFMGTSITHGYTDTSIVDTLDRWSARAAQMLEPYGNYREYNLGVPGTLLTTQIPNVPHKTAGMAWLALEFGSNELNDALLDTAAFRADYIAMIDTAIARGWSPSQISIMSQQAGQLAACGTTAQQKEFNYVDSTVALQFGITYIDVYNPLLLPQYQYIWDISVANIHPSVDEIPLLAQSVAGAISRTLQYSNNHQTLLTKDTAQFGSLMIKNQRYISNPKMLGVDQNGNVGIMTQLPANTRTQGPLQIGTSIIGLGKLNSLQNSHIPLDFDYDQDWLLPKSGKLEQWSGGGDSAFFQLMFPDGNTYLQNGGASGSINMTASSVALNASSVNINAVTNQNGSLNISNHVIVGAISTTQNVIGVTDPSTGNMVFNNGFLGGQYVWTVTNNYAPNAGFEAMRLFSNTDLTIGLSYPDTIPDIPSSRFTVVSGSQGSLPAPRNSTSVINSISSPADGLIAYDSTLHVYKYYDASTAAWVIFSTGSSSPTHGMVYSEVALGPALTNTTTAANLLGGTATFGANTLTAGETIVIHGFAGLSTAASSPGTLELTPWLNGAQLVYFTPSLGSGYTNVGVEITCYITILTTGSSGTMNYTMEAKGFDNDSPYNLIDQWSVNVGSGVTIDTTTPNTLGLGAKWSTASTSNSIQTLPPFTIKVE